MSSWGWGSIFFNLQAVNDFSIFGSKSSLFFSPVVGRPFFAKSWKKKNLFSFWILTASTDFCPIPTMSLRGPATQHLHNRARSASLMGLVDGRSNGFFIFLHTLWVYRTCIGLLIYMFKICHQLCYGFESFMSSWGSGSKISNLQQVGDVSFFRSKSSLFFSPTLERPFLRKNTNFLFFCIKDFTKDFTNDFVGRLF